jgi:hypothetical protein
MTYESLEDYLDDNIPTVKENIELAIRLEKTTDYLNQNIEHFFGNSKSKQEKYTNLFLEEYSEWGKKGEIDPQRLFIALYATTIEMLMDYYSICEQLVYLQRDSDDDE